MSSIGSKRGRGPIDGLLAGPVETRSVLERVSFALRVRRERRSLQALDDATLKDIGLSRSDVQREAMRGIFDLPMQNPTDRRYKI